MNLYMKYLLRDQFSINTDKDLYRARTFKLQLAVLSILNYRNISLVLYSNGCFPNPKKWGNYK